MGVEGVILAAGFSSRAKAYKMTLKIGNKAIIERSIDSVLEFCSRVIVVGGYKFENLIPILSKYEKVQLVYNENFQEGMFSSVKKGFSKVKEERFFFMPGDYPLIDKKVCGKLLNYHGDIIIPTYNERKGHPILIKTSIAKEVLEEDKYENLREFIKVKEQIFVPVENEGILLDIDTMEDYKKIVGRRCNKVHGMQYQ